ncbi:MULTISPECIES: GxxExxY protein [unclassified Novosphingobium]|uniref:GxxExxY protein n=1 Tax=unclassified Novosphingobium TaxID=2644732 RepID=UPI0025F3A101|nr:MULTISPECIES: GxxExxY protein [unclassified Novosphingobium]HQV02977.1 GxxExxY protein [Novosphingobium sp.]
MIAIDELSAAVSAEAIAIHKEFGPGLFETVYESVLAGRLRKRGLKVERQVQVKAVFDGEAYDPAFKIDILVDDRLVLEIKTVEQLSKAHAKQVLTYLRLLKQPVGLLLNFSEETMKDGIRRVVNDYRPELILRASLLPLRLCVN